ncbi:MAG TPA: glycine cleavage system protein GcvH [Sulfurimonas sp.]|nr:glycine cleavage system protein GcvH [Sulfurimonas sp.]
MAEFPENLRFAKSHEWAQLEDDGSVTVGISDHAQEALGDVVFVELPDIEASLEAGVEAGVVESVKAASDIYSPVSGTVIEINAELEDRPEIVNESPYDQGWFFRLTPGNVDELDSLLTSGDYQQMCEDESH